MAFIQPSVSEALRKELDRAAEMSGFIQNTIPQRFTGDTENVLVGALFSLLMEHHRAIPHLLGIGSFDGSALALVRPVVDAAYRAHWIYACAKPDDLQRISNGDSSVYPRYPQIADAVEAQVDAGGLFLMIKPYIKALHGYTHGGLEQLARRFSATGNLIPNYSDEEKTEAINATTAHLTALAIAWCQLVGDQDSAGVSRSAAISNHYTEHYPLPSMTI